LRRLALQDEAPDPLGGLSTDQALCRACPQRGGRTRVLRPTPTAAKADTGAFGCDMRKRLGSWSSQAGLVCDAATTSGFERRVAITAEYVK